MLDALHSISTHLTRDEKLLLNDLAADLVEGAVIVEIGSYLGASTAFLAHGVGSKGGLVFAVDSWQNDAMTEGARDTFDEFLNNTKEFNNVIKPLRGLSIDIAKSFDRGIDLLFIDGDHSYAGVAADINAWLPKLNDGAIIVFHDYSWAQGVQRAVKEIVLPVQADFGITTDSIYYAKVKSRKSQNNNVDVTVAIPTYHRNQYLLDALDSILQQETSHSYEVLVLDNACDGELESIINNLSQSNSIPIRYVSVPERGLHNCRNKALFVADSEIVAFVDDDVITPTGWLEQIIKSFDSNEVSMVAGKTLPQWEAEQPDWIDIIDPSYFSLLNLGDTAKFMHWPETPYGCNMAVRRHKALFLDGFAPDSIGSSLFEWQRGDGETGFARKLYEDKASIKYTPDGYLFHRVPAARLSKSYLYKRTIKSAISSFYSEMRAHRFNRKQLLIHAIRSIYLATKAGLMSLVCFFDSEAALTARLRSVNFACKALYQFRLALDKDLRDWVHKPHYLFDAGNRQVTC